MSQTSQELKYSDFQWQKGNNSTFLKINCNDYEMLTRPEIDALLSKFNEKLGGPGMMAVVDGHKLRMQRNNDETLTIWDNGIVGQQSPATGGGGHTSGNYNNNKSGAGGGGAKERAFWVIDSTAGTKGYTFVDNVPDLLAVMGANSTIWQQGRRNTPIMNMTLKKSRDDSLVVHGVLVAHEKNKNFTPQ